MLENSLPSLEDLDEDSLMRYIEKFLDISAFRSIQNGKMLLQRIQDDPDHPKIKTVMRKILGLFHTDAPAAKVCSLQFIKESMEMGSWTVVEAI